MTASVQENTRSLLQIAAINGQLDIAKLLIQHKIPINSIDHVGRTAMHYAVLGKNESMVTYLHGQVMIERSLRAFIKMNYQFNTIFERFNGDAD